MIKRVPRDTPMPIPAFAPGVRLADVVGVEVGDKVSRVADDRTVVDKDGVVWGIVGLLVGVYNSVMASADMRCCKILRAKGAPIAICNVEVDKEALELELKRINLELISSLRGGTG